jgi:GcrA cell cycle regulator
MSRGATAVARAGGGARARGGEPIGLADFTKGAAVAASPAWTDDRVQTLTRLWRDGSSASQIARALAGGVTRNAVMGKIHRLGLSGRAKPSRPDHRRSRKAQPTTSRRPAAPVLRFAPVRPSQAPQSSGSATVLSVRRNQCRWPIGDPLSIDFSLCGCAVERGAYCARHAGVAYRPLAKKPPRNHLLKLAGLA